MIPLKLTIKNFLSYGPTTQTIDFSAHQLMCLSGKNGHGKSALLDAITWVLWGQARKTTSTSKADEGLVHLGQTEMMVSIDVQIKDEIYRIRRECTRYSKRSKIVLDIGIIDTQTDTVRPLSETRQRCTQEHINTIIGLDYHTFVNSVFLRQGHANEFSKKTAKERKKILATILGLDQYDKLQKKALEEARKHQQEYMMLEKIIELLQTDIEQQEKISKEISIQEEEKKQIEKQEQEIIKKIGVLSKKKDAFFEKKQTIKHTEALLNQTKKSYKIKEQNLLQTWRAWRTTHATDKANKLQDIVAEKQSLISRATELEKKKKKLQLAQETLLKIKEKQYQLYKDIENKYTHQEQEHTHALYNAQNDIKRLHDHLNRLEIAIKKLQQKSQEEKASHDLLKKNLQKYRSQQELNKKIERYTNFIQNSTAQKATRSMRIKALNYDAKRIKEAHVAACPVCEQSICTKKKAQLLKDYLHKKNHALHQFNRLERIEKNITLNISSMKKEKKTVEDLMQKQKLVHLSQEKLSTEQSKYLEEKKEVLNNIEQAQKKLLVCMQLKEKHKKTKELFFSKNKSYQNLLHLRQKTENEIQNSTYNAQKHQIIEKQLAKIASYEQKIQEHLQAQALQKTRKDTVFQLCKELKESKKHIEIYTNIIKQYSQVHENIKLLEKEEQTELNKKQACIQKKLELVQIIGGLKEQKKRIDESKKTYQEHRTKQEKLTQEIEISTTLAQAMSKDGIQALVIENAIPEIEQEANALLSRLTQNKTHIIIDSTRDLKSGGTRETLDIKISDPAGIRPYEMFSGGEAFRIDFALRIALSKLLARRAGTTLQTLIIDEGFSSQDEEGLNHIVSTLNAIQHDFAKIIIVSHLPQLKEQFPIHFFIQKGVNGSSVKILTN